MHRKIRVIEAVNQLGLGGTEYALQLFSQYLNKELFEVTVVGLYSGGERAGLIESLGIPVKVLKGDLDQFRELLKESDVLHLHGDGNSDQRVFNIILENKPKLIIQTNVFGNYDGTAYYDAIDYDLHVSKMLLVRRMKADGEFAYRFAEKRKVLHNPVDCNQLRKLLPSKKELANFKSKHGLKGCFVAGRIGRADDHKFDLITLDSFARFVKHNQNAKFLLAGATEKMLSHAKALNILNHLVILPNTPDLKELLLYYKSMDVFLAISTIGESFGMVIAESMAAGVPVITVSTPDRDNAQIELVDNGVSGLVVSYSEESIAEALCYLYKNSRKRIKLGKNAVKKIAASYEASAIAKSLQTLILNHFEPNTVIQSDYKIISWTTALAEEYTLKLNNLFKLPSFGKRLKDFFVSLFNSK